VKRGGYIKRSRKVTGFDRQTKARILDRDGHRCVVCQGTGTLTVHHRLNRGMGGDPTVNTVRHGIAACWPCNSLMESDARVALVAKVNGWKLRHGDPITTPVLYPDGDWYVLDIYGQRTRLEGAA
jgi:hypothetical protein